MLTIKDIKDYKEKYFEEVLNRSLKNETKRLKELKYNKEEIDFLLDSLRNDIEKRFSSEAMENHKQELPNGTDISTVLKQLRGKDTERKCIILINDDNSYTYHTFDKGDEEHTNVSLRDIVQFLLNSNAKKFAVAHNHPKCIASIFSGGDVRNDYALSIMAPILGLEFVDSFVVTDFDTVSRYQLEKSSKENHQEFLNKYPVIHPQFMDAKISKELKKDNRILHDFLEINLKYKRR